jgi:hypothetical protein
MKRFMLAVALLISVSSLQAQTGLPSFGSFSPGGFDTIDNQNLNVLFSIPFISSTGRGMPLNFSLTYNSLIYRKYLGGWFPLQIGHLGWFMPGAGTVIYTGQTTAIKCNGLRGTETTYSNYAFADILGTVHPVPSINFVYSSCSNSWEGTFRDCLRRLRILLGRHYTTPLSGRSSRQWSH